jgi:predicted small lipoprotein YifL
MKKTIALLLVILLVLPIFAACGNDAANDTGTEAAATGDDAAATEGNAYV